MRNPLKLMLKRIIKNLWYREATKKMTEQEILKAAEDYCNTKACKQCDYWKTNQGCILNYPAKEGKKDAEH